MKESGSSFAQVLLNKRISSAVNSARSQPAASCAVHHRNGWGVGGGRGWGQCSVKGRYILAEVQFTHVSPETLTLVLLLLLQPALKEAHS